jgi:hypothetical protein
MQGQRRCQFFWGTYGVIDPEVYRYQFNIVKNDGASSPSDASAGPTPGGVGQVCFLSFNGIGQIDAITTDANGYWQFNNLSNGTYFVREHETTRAWEVVILNNIITVTRVTAGRGTFAFVGAGG